MMTIDPSISGTGISGSGPIGALGGASGDTPGAGLVDGFRALGTDIVAQVAGSFGLLPVSAPGQGDIYGLRVIADQVGAAFGENSAANLGALTRAIEDFAGAIATDMAAFADGRTLDLVDGALAVSPLSTAADLGGVIDALDQARTSLEAARSTPSPA
ncbi:hypothetical protein MOK15_21480 [Sphingobium sp. BYY-5]|uniref:hypothetical protein n=1 Tax=Sphingobium sp. BYY-5 TaxID=2926400 RepID=UPI001FA761D4|nr:hypothetical protein [Sphingobium sp. BYY-5]MCI4592632.1 hypothetical protein [Sphingobium sp. BYY-5]